MRSLQFSLPQMEYPLGGSSKKGSHVYFLLIVAMVLLLWCQIVLLWHQVTMAASSEQHSYQTIVLPRKLATGSIHDFCICYCPQGSGYSIWGTMNCCWPFGKFNDTSSSKHEGAHALSELLHILKVRLFVVLRHA